MMPSLICCSMRGKNWFQDVVIDGSCGCEDRETVGLETLEGTRKESSRVQILDFR